MMKPRSDVWAVLGGIRFALAMIVLGGHFVVWNASNAAFDQLASLCATTAVLCFLVVSGFSIAHSVGGGTDGFYTRRLLRIYPLYLLAIMAGVAAQLWLGLYDVRTPRLVVGNLLFLQTFRYPSLLGNPVLWSLAVEVAFYALSPLLRQWRTSTLMGLLGISGAAFVVFPRLGLPYYINLRFGLPMLFLGWAWLAGFVYYRCRGHRLAGIVLVTGMVVLTSCNDMFTSRHHQMTVVLAMLALVASEHVHLSAAARRVLSALGDLSYPLYLIHVPVLLVYTIRFHHSSPWPLLAMCIASAALMLAIDHQLKRPAARLAKVANAAGRSAAARAASEARSLGDAIRPALSSVFTAGVARGAVTAALAVTAIVGTAVVATAHAVTTVTTGR